MSEFRSVSTEVSRARSASVSKRVRWWIQISLVILTVAVFLGSTGHQFTNFDDPVVVTGERAVTGGLSLANLKWAFSHSVIGHWDPLTTISHQVVCEFFGVNPAAHHFTNVLLHSLTVLLLFVVLFQWTGAVWRSALVAALFGLHPLRVESVAWVTERKDVLSGVFFMLTLLSYTSYCRQRNWGRYLVVLVVFSCGLMSKSMLVTLPLVLLLLDYWPLGNLRPGIPLGEVGKRIGEKLPLLGLSVLMSLLQVQAVAGAIEAIPLVQRVENAIVCYVAYLGKLVWPVDLSVFYPHPKTYSWPIVLVCVAILLATTSAAIGLRRSRPYLLVGWFWFLGMLVPVIGLLQVGTQSMADRYSYLPSIGFFLIVVWAGAELTEFYRVPRALTGSIALMTIAGLARVSVGQLAYWSDSETLFRHALAVTKENSMAHLNLGNRLVEFPGRRGEAVAEYEKALQIVPANAEVHLRLGSALIQLPGRAPEGLAEIEKALALDPNLSGGHYLRGLGLTNLPGRAEEAIHAFELDLTANPRRAEGWNCLGNALSRYPERYAEAMGAYEKAIEIEPEYAEAHNNLGSLLLLKPERLSEAVRALSKAVRIKPDLVEARCNLGLAYAQIAGQLPEAIRQFEIAVQLRPELERAQETLKQLRALLPAGRAEGAPSPEEGPKLKH